MAYFKNMAKRRLTDRADMNKRLRETREALGHFNANEYARTAGIKETTYNNYENGHRIGLDGAVKLCETYLLSLDWIYFGEPSALLSMPSAVAEKIRAYRPGEQPETKKPPLPPPPPRPRPSKKKKRLPKASSAS